MKLNTSIVVDSQAPEFIRSDYAKFLAFLQAYYEYLEQSGKALDVLRNLDTFNDIDEQLDDTILGVFYGLFLPDFPNIISVDKKFTLKQIAHFYNSKGSIDSIKAFFRIVYGEEVKIYLPKEDLLKLNTGVWKKVFKIKVTGLSAGLYSQLNGCEIYQVDPINGNKTVRARVVDWSDSNDTILFLSADNIVLNFSTSQPIYCKNLNGVDVTFSLQSQFSTTTVSSAGLNYSPGMPAVLLDADANTENIKVEQVTRGTIKDIVIENVGDDYSIFDKVVFSSPNHGDVPAKAKIETTTNKDYITEIDSVLFAEPEDKIVYENGTEIKQEYGTFGSLLSTPSLSVADETANYANTGSLSSNEFGFLLEDQQNDVDIYNVSSYTYNQGLFRPLLPRVGATSNFSLNWARNEGISCILQDEELWVGSVYCTEGTPAKPGTVLIQFETEADYNNLEYFELTKRTSTTSTAPTVGTINLDGTQHVYLDSKVPRRYSLQQQLGAYDYGQDTLTSLYPFSENNAQGSGPVVYIRERNTLFGHDLNTTRPWEYRFVFKKGSVVRFKLYIMPVQYDLRSEKVLLEDGSDIYEENDASNILLQEAAEIATNTRVGFDPSAVSSNQITIANHGFVQNQIIRYNTFADIDGGIFSDTVGGIVDGELFYCHVVNSNTIKLMPYGTNSESVNYGLFRTITPAATSGTTCYFSSFTGDHVTNGADYTSTSVDDSAITVYGRKRSAGAYDLGMKYNKNPYKGTDPVTGLDYETPYDSRGRMYLYPSLQESTDYIVLERADYDNSTLTLALEIDKRSDVEALNYPTYSFLATENSTQTVVHNINDINIPEESTVKIMVERKTLQLADDVNRGSQRLPKVWNDFADISINQELYNLAPTRYADEYAETPYVSSVIPSNAFDVDSGPGEFSNTGVNLLVATTKSNSIYYTDGTGAGLYKYASEFDEQRRVCFVESSNYNNNAAYPTATNGPIGVTAGSTTANNANSKRYFSINFALPKELNKSFDMPFEVNLTNIINAANTGNSFITKDVNDYITMEGSAYYGEQLFLLESGDQIAVEKNTLGYNSIAGGNQSTLQSKICLEFFSPSLSATNPKKHLIYYCDSADYTYVSSDVQRTIYSFYNCWSPNMNAVPDTTVNDYTVVVRSLQKSDYIIEKVSDVQNIAKNVTSASDDFIYNNSPFQQQVVVSPGIDNYGKYISGYYGTINFGGNDFGDMSGTIFSKSYTNPLHKSFFGAFPDKNISVSRYFDPSLISSSIITLPNHGLVDGSWVRFRTDYNGAGPVELTDNTTYYVKVISANQIKLASSIANYNSSTFMTLTAYGTAGKTCTLQTVPQSLSFSSVKDLSFDQRKFIKQVGISLVDTGSGTITTTTDHTLSSLTPVKYTTDGTNIGGVYAGIQYYAIVVTGNQLKLASSITNALSGIYVNTTSAGTGNQYIVINGVNGSMLPYESGSTREQKFYTPGQYTNFLKVGEQVAVNSSRLFASNSSTVGVSDTAYIQESNTGLEESFRLTKNNTLTSSNFGSQSIVVGSQTVGSNKVSMGAIKSVFRNGDEVKIYYSSGTFVVQNGITNNLTTLASGSTVYIYRKPQIVSNVATGYTDYNFSIALTKQAVVTGDVEKLYTLPGSDITIYTSNEAVPAEVYDIVPTSVTSNINNVLHPGVVGTGIEEYSIIYTPTLQSETGKLEKVTVTSPGSYLTIPTVSIVTSGNRTGSGGDIWPVVNGVGKINSLEILDGGIHQTTKDLLLPDSVFINYSSVSKFTVGSGVNVNSTYYGTILSVSDHYITIQPDGSTSTRITYGDVLTYGTISATVGRYTRSATIGGAVNSHLTSGKVFIMYPETGSIGDRLVVQFQDFNTGEELNHNYQYGEKIKIVDCLPFIPNGTYYVIPHTDTEFYLTTDSSMNTYYYSPSLATANFSGTDPIIWSGVFTGAATASPGAITTSTENGSSDNYSGDKGLLNTWSKIQDSSYYQDYSYVVRGSNSHDDWKQYFNKLVHPAGMAVFGEVDYFTLNSGTQLLGNTVVSSGAINNTTVGITTTMTT